MAARRDIPVNTRNESMSFLVTLAQFNKTHGAIAK
jgi:hypothetical protein